MERAKRLDVLHKTVAEPPREPSPTEYWLTQRATLVVAGAYLQAGEYRAARTLLRRIPIESPAAVQAGLLLAESFRLEGKGTKARQWYLRMGQRFPHNHDALKGMLAAADAMRDAAPESALALYDRVGDRAAQTADRLSELLPKVEEKELAIIFDPSLLASNDLRRQLLEQLAHNRKGDAIAIKRAELRTDQSLACLLEGSRSLYQARAGLQRELIRARNRIPRLREDLERDRRELRELRDRIQPGELNENQRRIRKRAMALRNRIQHSEARLAFLRDTVRTAPEMMRRLEERLLEHYSHFRDQRQQDSRKLNQLLTDTIKELRDAFLDTAGEAHRRHAQLLEASARAD